MSRADDTGPEDAARAARAVARSRVVTASVQQLGDDDCAPDAATPEARIELLVQVTRAAWALTGAPWPTRPRSEWPIRVRRLGDEA